MGKTTMLPDLAFRITAQAATAAAFAKTKSDVAGIRGELSLLGTQARAVFAGLATSLGVAALAQIPRIVGDIAARGAELQTTADKIGVTVEELQKLRYAGQQANVEAGQIDEAFAKFSKNMGDAARGAAPDFRRALELNGIALRNSDGSLRTTMQVAMDYADVIKNARNEQDRNVLSTIGFGKANDELGQVFRDGAAGMKAAGDELERINGITSAADVQKLADTDAAYDKLSATFSHFQDAAVVAGVGVLGDYVNQLDVLGKSVDDFFANPNAKNFIKLMLGEHVAESLSGGGVGSDTHPTENKGDFLSISKDDFNARFGKPSVVPPPPPPGQTRADPIQRVIDSLTVEHENLTRNSRDQEIYNALARAGTTINTERGKQIATLAGNIYDESEAIRKQTDEMDGLREAAKDVLGGFIDDLRQGKSLADALGDAMQRVADKIIDNSLDSLLDNVFGAPGSNRALSGVAGGGILGFIGGLFTGPHAAGGFIPAGKVGTSNENEMLIPGAGGVTVIPPRKSAGGGIVIQNIVNNNSSASASQRQERTPNGVKVITDIVDKHIATGGADQPMRRFGARPVKTG
jgi:hypothetical protein